MTHADNNTDLMLPTDSFLGRLHIHAANFDTRALIRPLDERDRRSAELRKGSVGNDYVFRWNPRETAQLLTGEDYQRYWTVVDRRPEELLAQHLYDRLQDEGIDMLSNVDLILNAAASGVAVQIIWGPAPPHTSFYRLAVRGDEEERYVRQVASVLQQRLDIHATPDLESSGWCLEFPLREYQPVTA